VQLENKTIYTNLKPRVYVETPPSYYSENVTELFADKDWVTKIARRNLGELNIVTEAKSSQNKNGDFIYLIGVKDNESPDKCIFSMQLSNEASTDRLGRYYHDSILFLYCLRDTSENDLLKYFNSVRIKSG